jgi:parallel beta-helix repeat protein
MRIRVCAVAVVAAAALVPSLRADETTYCKTFITSLPYTITTQGHYCFDRNLSTAASTGAAITINSDFVVLDLNNFKLGGGAAGLATQAVGIQAVNHSNITVRNGNIRGFLVGIQITAPDEADSQNNVVENNVLDGNTNKGIAVRGRNNVVRNNVVGNTGGSTVAPPLFCTYGIETCFGAETGCSFIANYALVQGNLVSGVINPEGGTCAIGIYSPGSLGADRGGVVAGNVVQAVQHNAAGGVPVVGGICRDNTVYVATGNDAYSCITMGPNNVP